MGSGGSMCRPGMREAVAAAAAAGAEDLESLLRGALQVLRHTLYASLFRVPSGMTADAGGI
jgi:hypothetical protein